ncbi:MAG: ABC transporter permease, partial [Chloroflexi bacterium]|nr:ABC transporter permease [Chloroflexota bacterium]
MLEYIVRRMFLFIFVLFGLTLVLFFLTRLVPADPAVMAAGLEARPEALERMRKEMGLDKPIYVQYLNYMNDLLRGDLGRSVMTRRPISLDLKERMPATLELVGVAWVLIVVFGLGLGLISAYYRGGWVDMLARLFAYFGVGTPIFWLGLMLIVIFFSKLRLLPAIGRLPIGVAGPANVTGFYLLDSLLARDWQFFFITLQHLILPASSLALGRIALISRITSRSIIDQMNLDYIRTARAKGLRERAIIFRHALKNAFLPVLTVLGLQFGWMLTGSLLIEYIFSWPGIGTYA